jgi:hypothetical protein
VSETLYVTRAQVLAAKLALELNVEAGEPPNEALQAIANAREIAPQESASSPRTGADDQSLPTLQRIQHQLDLLSAEAWTHEPSQSPTQPKPPKRGEPAPEDLGIQDPTLANVNPDDLDDQPPWMINARRHSSGGERDISSEQPYPGQELGIGIHAGEPEVGQRGGTMSEEERERLIAEYNQRKRDGQLGPQGPDIEGRDQGTDQPWSGPQR